MKFIKSHKNLAAGLTAVLATLLAVIIACTMLCFQWEGQVDLALGVDASSTYEGVEITENDVYYKSAFGDLAPLYKSSSDVTSEETAAISKSVEALMDAEKEYAAREAEEGDVLLKNGTVTENGESVAALPLKASSKVTLFGRAAGNPVYRSTSGGSKSYNDTSMVISLSAALAANGVTVNPTLQSALEGASSTKNVTGTNGSADIGELATSFYSSYASTYSSYNDAAIVVLSREGGEGNDLNTKDKDGISELALHDSEAALLKMVKDSGAFSRIIVLINSGFPMELGWLDEEQYGVDACLWIGEPGTFGFGGVAKVLTGEANPSGRLVDTYAANSLSSPAVQNFGDIGFTNNSSYKYLVEAEGIYTGYKYYETRYEDSVLNSSSNAASPNGSSTSGAWSYADEVVFPFGYGLSYTTFSQEIKEDDGVTYDEAADTYTVTVTVTNTGSVPGKCSVPVYVQIPYDSDVAETESIRLVGFNKTLGTKANGEAESADYDVTDIEAGTLAPGESEDVEVTVDGYLLAVYDEDARSGKGGYVLPKGDYYFAVGDDIHAALNNIMGAKDENASLVDQNGNAYTADSKQVCKLNNIGSELDESTYAASPYTGEDVSNTMETADINYYLSGSDKITYLSRSDWGGTWTGITNISLSATSDMMDQMDGGTYTAASDAPKKGTYTQGQNNGIDFIDMKDVPYTGTYTDADGNEKDADEQWDKFLDQLTSDQLAENTSDTADAISSVNSPKIQRNDGPDGIGATLANGSSSTCYNSEIVLSSTFSPKMLQLRGSFMAEDCLWTKYAVIWGPGCNIHRTPFSGRNYEYYSECGYMNYLCGAYEIPAMTEKGVAAAEKHFVGNDQETNRMKVATFSTEQAWRQTMLKGFEGAIAKGKSLGVMTSYNCIGVDPSAQYKATNVDIMQTEWGFHGFNTSDGSGNCTYMDTVTCVVNGTCVFCLDNRNTDLKKAVSRDTTDSVVEALRQANKQIFWSVLRTNAVNGVVAGATVVSSTSWWKTALISVISVFAVLTALGLAWYVTAEVFNILDGRKPEDDPAGKEE